MAMNVGIVSECFIEPHHHALEDSKHPPFYLTPWDLYFINSQNHTRKGLLYAKPHPPQSDGQYEFMNCLLDRLKHSLSLTLTHFYPLAGRLRTIPHEDEDEDGPVLYSFYVDCNSSPGVKFIYATSDFTVSDILSPIDVPASVLQTFYHDDTALLDLHAKSLVTITVTELVDGVFIACAMNHIVADGNSFCHFLNMWSEIFNTTDAAAAAGCSLSRPPILERWFPPDGYGPIVKLPYAYQNTHVSAAEEAPPKCRVRARIFHLSSETVAKLKAEANAEFNYNSNLIIISSLQSLSAFLWRSVTKARRLPSEQKIIFVLPANNRSRLNPPLSPDYFGNAVGVIASEIITAGELLQHHLGWAAWKLHQAMAGHTDKEIRRWLDVWLKSPRTLTGNDRLADVCTLGINDFTKFNTLDNEFGMGKPLAFCSGYRNRITDGNVIIHSGRQPGSIVLELMLLSETMSHLESDNEFMEIVSA